MATGPQPAHWHWSQTDMDGPAPTTLTSPPHPTRDDALQALLDMLTAAAQHARSPEITQILDSWRSAPDTDSMTMFPFWWRLTRCRCRANTPSPIPQ